MIKSHMLYLVAKLFETTELIICSQKLQHSEYHKLTFCCYWSLVT